MKKNTLLTSILTLLLCVSLIAGSTFALLSSTTRINIAIGSGKVKLTASLQTLRIYSMEEEQFNGYFANGGTASIDRGVLDLNLITPGDKVTAEIAVKNNSTIGLKYRVVMRAEGALMDALNASVTIDGNTYPIASAKNATPWIRAAAGEEIPSGEDPILVSVELPAETTGNEFQNSYASISITLEAVQGNAELWDGTASTDWYNNAPAADTFEIRTAQELAGLSTVLSSYADSFNGKTIRIMNNIDLSGHVWTPIELNGSSAPAIVIDGGGNTISGMMVEGDSNVGLIGSCNASLTIRDLILEDVSVAATGSNVGAVIGYQQGDVTLQNVDVINATIYTTNEQGAGLGALVGYSAQKDGASLVLTNCDVTDSVVVGYRSIGALVGSTEYASDDRMTVNGCTAAAKLVYRCEEQIGAQDWATGANGFDAAGFRGENNTASNQIVKKTEDVIYTVADLFALADRVNVEGNSMKGKTILLANDIDLNGAAWTPIGTGAAKFEGVFDGCGYTIYDLDVSCNAYGGLFGRVFKGVVKNVNLENVVIYSGFTAGAIAASVYGEVLNCAVKNAQVVCYDLNSDIETGKGDNVGGLIGYIADEGVGSKVIGNKVTNAYVSGNRDLGQLIGYADKEVTVSDNLVEEVEVRCNGYTKNYESVEDLRIGGLIGNRD